MSLNLDNDTTIKEVDTFFNHAHSEQESIYRFIKLLQKYGRKNKDHYILNITYLTKDLELCFVHDSCMKFLRIYYTVNGETYLKICFRSGVSDPLIEWIKDDHRGNIPKADGINGASYLINLSHRLLSYLGYDRCALDDDSYLELTGTKCKLWLYLLLTRGRSWYAKFGYVSEIYSQEEYLLRVRDLKNISLHKIDETLVEIEKNVIEEIKGKIKAIREITSIHQGTLEQYSKNNNVEDVAKLINLLFDSSFCKEYTIGSRVIKCEWYCVYERIFLANINQINSNIRRSYVRLSNNI